MIGAPCLGPLFFLASFRASCFAFCMLSFLAFCAISSGLMIFRPLWMESFVSESFICLSCAIRSCRAFFSAAFLAFISFRAISTGHTKVRYSHRQNPHSRAAGRMTARRRYLGQKKRFLLTKRAEKKIFRPLLSDVPAVRTKYTTVCHILSGWLCLILRPET